MNLSVLKKFEGCKLTAYPDPATGAEPITIGYGSTLYENGAKVKMGDKITQERAEQLLLNTLNTYIDGVKKTIKVPLSDNKLSACVTLAYNIGVGNFSKSTVAKLINQNPNDPAIKAAWLMWNKANGKVMKALQLRREAEINLYFS